MKLIYKARITVKADIEEVADFFCQDDMTKNYFPEVRKDTKGMTAYIYKTHKHADQVFPDYQIHGQGLGWTTAGKNCIKVPRKDIKANIQGIEVDYKATGNNTEIVIKVGFNPDINLGCIIAAYHVHMMVTNKLNAIKRDIEADLHHGYTFSIA